MTSDSLQETNVEQGQGVEDATTIAQTRNPQPLQRAVGSRAPTNAPSPVLAPFVRERNEDEYEFFVADLKKSSLEPSDLRGWFAVGATGIRRFCRRASDSRVTGGYAIPYHDLNGALIQDASQPFIRFRLMLPVESVKRADGTWKDSGKYLSPTDTSSHLYIPRATAQMLRDGVGDDLPLVITEGEKKAEAFVKHTGIPCVALAGIFMWFDPAADRREAASARPLHPELVEVLEAYRKWVDGKPVVLVVFDSDGCPAKGAAAGKNLQEVRDGRGRPVRVRNSDVYRQALQLANRIYADFDMALATAPAWCPEAQGKQGLDDWIQANGPDDVRDAVLGWAARPANRIANRFALPACILTNNLGGDIDSLSGALSRHEDLYVFGTNLAVVEQDSTSIRVILDEGTLAEAVSRVVQTFGERNDGGVQPCYVPQRLSSTMLKKDWSVLPAFRKIQALAQHPVPMLLGDEVYLSQSGYDARAALFGAFDAEAWNVPFEPTEQEFRDACIALGELIHEMYLQGPADIAAALAAILTAVCRPGLPVAPGFVLSAPNSGAGKSYFAQVLTELASVHEADVLTLETRGPNANSEFSKMVLGALSTSRPVMLFDEIDDNKIDGPSLRKLITSPVFSGRRLGVNEVMTLPTRKLVLITANNVDPTQDSARRFIIVRINPPSDAAKRNQRPDRGAVDLVHENRAKYARAAAVVSLAGMHRLAGLPFRMPPGIDILSGFPAWSRVCAAPALLAAWFLIRHGFEPVNLVDKGELEKIASLDPIADPLETLDPMLRQKQTRQMDPARLAVRALLESLYQFQTEKVACSQAAGTFRGTRGEQGFTTELLVAELREQYHLAERYQRDYNSDIEPVQFALLQELRASGLREDQLSNSRSLGKTLSKYRDTEVAGYTLRQIGSVPRTSAAIWHVAKASEG